MIRSPHRLICRFAAVLGIAALAVASFHPAASGKSDQVGASGLPLPRFVSFKADVVNLRTGPGTRYPIEWIYQRRGMPVQITDEFEDWRRVRDYDGTMGWVHRFMLRSRRTVLITGDTRLLRRRPEPDAPGLAYLEPGVIADFEGCRQAWCRVEAQGFTGWLHRGAFFGANADD